MSIDRPVALSSSGSQGTISQTFFGQFSWEAPGWLRRLLTSASKGKRAWFSRAVKYDHIHLAIDYIVGIGTAVKAVKRGVIVAQGPDSTGAHLVYLRIRRGVDFDLFALYYHLKPDSYRYRNGTVVDRGVTIALSGNSGWSTGPHLHFEIIRARRGASISEVYRDGVRIDPQPIIRGIVSLRSLAP